MKILIVDDNAKVRQMLSDLLKSQLLQIHECSDGFKAIEMYRKLQPDWVLMDLKLETMDGITATKHIHSEYPESKIVVVSSYGDDQFRNAAKRAGALAYVLKDNLRDVVGVLQQPIIQN